MLCETDASSNKHAAHTTPLTTKAAFTKQTSTKLQMTEHMNSLGAGFAQNDHQWKSRQILQVRQSTKKLLQFCISNKFWG